MESWIHTILTYLSLILLVSVFLSSLSPKWDYRVKMFWVYMAYLINTSITVPYCLIVRNPMKGSLFMGKLFVPVSKWLKLKWTIIGKENVDRSKCYVVVCNHQSALDGIAASEVSLCWRCFKNCYFWKAGFIELFVKSCHRTVKMKQFYNLFFRWLRYKVDISVKSMLFRERISFCHIKICAKSIHFKMTLFSRKFFKIKLMMTNTKSYHFIW